MQTSKMIRSIACTMVVCAALPTGLFAQQQDSYATAAELKLMEGFPPPPERRVTQETALQTPPFNRWSYQHMRMFYPSAPIAAAEKPVPLSKTIDWSIEQIEIPEPDTDQVTDLDTFLKKTYTDALVVIKGHQIVWERFLNGMHANQPHQMMSVTKSFCGLLGLMAVEEGTLKESDRVAKYVPELEKAGAFAGATLGQVLDMTNSMDFSEDYDDPRSGIFKYIAALGWREPPEGTESEESLHEFLLTLDIDKAHKHGERFYYQTPKTDALNWVINRMTGHSFQDAMYDKLWSKLGTKGETYVLLDKSATLVAGGGLNATPYNLARFAIMMLSDGQFNGRQVLSPSIIEMLAKGGDKKAFDRYPYSGGTIFPKGNWSYRAQWWVRHTPGKEAIMAIGIHGQWIYINVDHDIAIIKQSSQPEAETDYMYGYQFNGFDAIVDHLTKGQL